MNKTGEKIIKHLREKRGSFVSGSTVSLELGISRAAVWKQIQNLRRLGYLVSARSNLGYRLDDEPDLLDSERLQNRDIHYYKVVDSTNFVARRLAEEGAPEYSVTLADEQLQGRGRLGRNWFSPPGSGLWFSLILRPKLIGPAEAAPITLVTAAVMANYFRLKHSLPVSVKWPNDLLLKTKKVGGILTETRGEPDRIEYLIIGIGLNVNQKPDDFPVDIGSKASSLAAESGTGFDRTALFLALKEELIKSYRRFFVEGFPAFRRLWKNCSVTLGKEVNIRHPGGTTAGLALDIDESGALLIKDQQGRIHTINYGEVSQET